MDWRQWLYVAFLLAMMFSLFGFAAYLWLDKSRADRIERQGLIPLQEEPLHPLKE